ncbi:MAG TPA: general secretion pathway protein GspK [Acidobacteriota bacterium]|nr:general secretion pathway protein GspK [Acidobacteriota bacterium]
MNFEVYDRVGSDDQKGAVLIVVLWVLIALSLLALSFSASVRTEVNAARNTVDQKQAYYRARAGVDYAVYRILEAQSAFSQAQQALQGEIGQQVPDVLTGFLRLDLADGGADIEVIDESGKLNLNLAPAHLIYNLLIIIGVDPVDADVITDSIEDWRDQDDFYRPNGAESDYYQSLERPYFAKNGLFDVPEELLLVRGVTPEIYYGRKGLTESGERVEYYGLQKYFTTFSTISRININSAPLPVLAAIPGLDYDVAQAIVAMRQEAPLMGIEDVMGRIPGIPTEVANYLSMMQSQVYTIISTGSLNHSEVICQIRAVIRVGGMGPKPYLVLYWNESNLEM